MNVPDIGLTVVRVMPDGSTRKDWIRMMRIDHGPDPQDAEIGVLCWGSDGARFQNCTGQWFFMESR